MKQICIYHRKFFTTEPPPAVDLGDGQPGETAAICPRCMPLALAEIERDKRRYLDMRQLRKAA
jgi:hypothetical protein